MKRFSERGLKRWGGLAFGMGLTTFCFTAAQSQDANALSWCRNVRAVIVSTVTSENCTSPVGICTQGVITGGILHGATVFAALNLAPSAGMPDTVPPDVLSYSGVLTVQTKRGSLTTRDIGILDTANQVFTEIDRVSGGTGRFEGATGVLFISGPVTGGGTGFEGQITGEICD